MTKKTATAKFSRADITQNEDGAYTVDAVWAGVDRPVTFGINCGKSRRLADRVSVAMKSGAAFANAEIRTDNYGSTYVAARCVLNGRTLNADLCRLGF